MKKFSKYIYLFIINLVFFIFGSSNLIKAQGNYPPSSSNTIALLSDREYFLSIAVLVFGFFIILCEVFLLKNFTKEPESILLTIVTTLIVISGLFIITAGLTTEQVAPAFGLYGAIVGYLLGKDSRNRASFKKDEEEDNDEK